jgi:hypothetical protein
MENRRDDGLPRTARARSRAAALLALEHLDRSGEHLGIVLSTASSPPPEALT